MYFDTHAHFNDKRFNSDRDALIASLADHNVTNVVNVGYDMKSSHESVKLAEKYDFFYAAAGIHPHDAKTLKNGDTDEIAKLCTHKKVVAIGEIGLDYYRDISPRNVQQECFKTQLSLARDLDMSVIIHMRDATADTMKIIGDIPVKGGVLHCFSGSVETAKIALKLGYYISFAGPVTFKNAGALIEVAKFVPDDRILAETDCPYLAPEPYRGMRNSSVYVVEVVKKLAELRGKSVQDMANLTTKNAKTLFTI